MAHTEGAEGRDCVAFFAALARGYLFRLELHMHLLHLHHEMCLERSRGWTNIENTWLSFITCFTILVVFVSFASSGPCKTNKRLLSTIYVLTNLSLSSYASVGCTCGIYSCAKAARKYTVSKIKRKTKTNRKQRLTAGLLLTALGF